MNTLSWLIYLADVADNLDWFFFLMMVLSLIATVIWGISAMAITDEGEDTPLFWRTWRRIALWGLAPAFFCGVVLGSVVPSRDTVYAIAASEMGERALNTPTAAKAFRALDKWLEKQINGNEESESESKKTDKVRETDDGTE